MLKRFREYVLRRFWNSHEQCYAFMESTGYALKGECGGRYTTNIITGTSDPECECCPHWVRCCNDDQN